jgi:HSP20 family molecular chaperone IbpA
MFSSALSPFRAFPLTPFGPSLGARLGEPFDPFFSTASPFALLPSGALSRSLAGLGNEMPRVDAAAEDKSLRVTFPGDLSQYDNVDVSIDAATNMLVLKASSADGNSRTSRVVSLPCAVQNADKVVAEINERGNIVVTVPAESQKALTDESALAAPTTSVQPRKLKIKLRPAETGPTPEFEVNEDDVGFSISVLNVSPDDVYVFADGKTLHVSCKAFGGDGTPFSRNFELPRKVVDPSMITANVSICEQHQQEKQHSHLDISVPKDALEPEPAPGKSGAVSIPVQVGQSSAAA